MPVFSDMYNDAGDTSLTVGKQSHPQCSSFDKHWGARTLMIGREARMLVRTGLRHEAAKVQWAQSNVESTFMHTSRRALVLKVGESGALGTWPLVSSLGTSLLLIFPLA